MNTTDLMQPDASTFHRPIPIHLRDLREVFTSVLRLTLTSVFTNTDTNK